jgi:hypothetical protein
VLTAVYALLLGGLALAGAIVLVGLKVPRLLPANLAANWPMPGPRARIVS